MGGLFGGGNKNKNKKNDKRKNEQLSEKDKAELQVKRQRDRLKKYETECEKVIARETEMCKQLLKQGKKDKAKLVLRKKKYQEKLLDNARNQLTNIEELSGNIEFAQMQQQVMKAMEQGTNVLKEINAQMSLEEIEQIMDDTQEAIEYQNEVNALLSQNLTEEDDEDVLKELEMIEQQEADVCICFSFLFFSFVKTLFHLIFDAVCFVRNWDWHCLMLQ